MKWGCAEPIHQMPPHLETTPDAPKVHVLRVLGQSGGHRRADITDVAFFQEDSQGRAWGAGRRAC